MPGSASRTHTGQRRYWSTLSQSTVRSARVEGRPSGRSAETWAIAMTSRALRSASSRNPHSSFGPVLPEGQLLLVSPPRHFSLALAARIDDRWIPGFEEVAAEAKCWAAQERFDEVRRVGMRRTAGLVLAAGLRRWARGDRLMTVGTGTAFGQRKNPQALLSYGPSQSRR